MGDEVDQDMPDVFDPANGELRNGDAPAAANQEAVLEVKDLEGLATTSCACAPNIKGVTYCQFFSLLLVTNKSYTAGRNFCGSNSRTAVYVQHTNTRWQFVH
jgi:hypothetical protein